VKSIAAHPVTDDLGINFRAARFGKFEFFQNNQPRAFTATPQNAAG
jgi:hypothetical protein